MSYPGGPYYPQYPLTYPSPPPSRRPSRWPAFGTERGILLYVLAPLVAVLLVVLLAVGISAARPRALAQTPLPTVAGSPAATITPQGTPLATDTPAPASLVTTATMGGTFDAFDAAYGPTASADVWNATIAGQQVQFMVTFSYQSDSADGTPRGIIINVVTPSFTGWDPATSAQIAAAFLPPDARFLGTSPGPTGHTDHNYVSAQLANSLVSSVFTTDDLSRRVTPGSVYWSCDASTGCYMSIGTYN